MLHCVQSRSSQFGSCTIACSLALRIDYQSAPGIYGLPITGHRPYAVMNGLNLETVSWFLRSGSGIYPSLSSAEFSVSMVLRADQ